MSASRSRIATQDQDGQALGSGGATSPGVPKAVRPSSNAGIKSPTVGIRSPTSGIASPMPATVSPGTGAAKSKAVAPKAKGSAFSSKPANSNPGVGVASPRAVAARPKSNSPKSKSGVLSPNPEVPAPGTGIASPQTRVSRAGAASPNTDLPKTKSGVLSPKRDDSTPRPGIASPKVGTAVSKTNLPKTKTGVLSPKRDDSTPRPGIASPRTGIASVRVGTAVSKTNLPKTKTGVLSPKRDDSTPGPGIASPRVGTAVSKTNLPKTKTSVLSTKRDDSSPGSGVANPRGGPARPKTNLPKTKSGTLSPKSYNSSPRAGSAGPKAGDVSPRTGVVSPRQGAASPRAGIASPGLVASSLNVGVTSPRTGVSSPKTGARSPKSGTGSTKFSAARDAASPLKISAPGSVSPRSKGGQDDDIPEPPVLPKSRRLAVGGRRKSVGAAAMLNIVRKSLKPQSGGEGSSGESLSSKGQLNLFMVATVGGFIFVFVIIVTFFYLISRVTVPEGIACVTEECQRAQEYLDGLLDQAKDPCVDFYGYVCDSWKQKGTSFHAEAALSLLFRLNTTLFHKRKDFRKDEQRQGMHILGPVYRSCYLYMSMPGDLKEALQEAQTVLLIQQLMHAATFFDVVRYLVRQSLQLGVYTLFHVRFVHEDGRPMLFMHEGYTLEGKLGQSLDTADARDKFEDILKLWLDRDNVSDALQLLVDMDTRVKKFFDGKEPVEIQQTLQQTVADLVVNVTANDWVAAVSDSHRQTLVLVPTDEVIVRGAEIFKPAIQLVVEHGLRKATFYLATVFEADVVYILSSRDRIAQSPVHKALYCLSFAHKALALTWAYLAARHLSPHGSTGVIYDMLSFMKEIVAEEESEVFGWMKDTTRTQATDTVSKTALDVIAGEEFNVSRVDYTGPEPQLDESASFLKTLAAALRHHHTVMARNPPTRLEMLISDLEFENTISYISARKTILVPTVYQNDPYLYPFRVPDYFNYGTLGALIAGKLAEVVGLTLKGPRQASWDQDTLTSYGELLGCLAALRTSMGFGDFNSATVGTQQTLMVTLSFGVRLAYLALMNAFRKEAGTRKVFNDYLPQAQHVFFTRFCLLWCSASETPGALTPREKCMLPLYNMEEFAERYSCRGHANFTISVVCQA